MSKHFFVVLLFISLFSGLNNVLYASPASENLTFAVQKYDYFAASQKYINELSPEQKKNSDNYFEGGYWLLLWNILAEIFVAVIFLFAGLSGWVKDIATKVQSVNLQNLIYAVFYFLLSYLLVLPLNVYQNYFREHLYNLSNLTFVNWVKEDLISLTLTVAIGSLLAMLVYIAIRKVKQNWWIWAGSIIIAFMLTGAFIYPVFISPLFNNYKPLAEGKLKNEILSIAHKNGLPATNVYEFDESKQDTKISANVSGFGKTVRISLNDNLINKCSPSEVRAVMAHEIGHYVLKHIYITLILSGFLVFICLYFVNIILNKCLAKWGCRWKIKEISDIATLPLLIVLFNIFIFLATPFQNNISRNMEVKADLFGLNAAKEPDGAASAAMKLSAYRKISPGTLEEILFYDHPSGKTRVMNAMKWKAEHSMSADTINLK